MKKRPQVIVSIDPGVKTLGLCVWDVQYTVRGDLDFRRSPFRGGHAPRPIYAEAVEFTPRSLPDAAEAITDYLHDTLTPFRPTHAVIERMEFFGGTARGIAATVDVLDVAAMTGAMTVFFQQRGAIVTLTPVRTWKGQLSKDQVSRRLLKKWGLDEMPLESLKSHAIDAAGIGLHFMGKF